MARPTRDERKAELLAAILDYLMDKTLAELTFRSLAEGLGMSAYVLVYHFGSRDQLINDIVVSIESRLDRMQRLSRPAPAGSLAPRRLQRAPMGCPLRRRLRAVTMSRMWMA